MLRWPMTASATTPSSARRKPIVSVFRRTRRMWAAERVGEERTHNLTAASHRGSSGRVGDRWQAEQLQVMALAAAHPAAGGRGRVVVTAQVQEAMDHVEGKFSLLVM